MSQARGRVWVDSEGVVRTGGEYDQHVDDYDRHLQELEGIYARYVKSFGKDDMGVAFTQRVDKGVSDLQNIIGGIRGQMAYAAEGLTAFGKAYQEADDAAADAGHQLDGQFSELQTGTRQSAVRASEPLLAREGVVRAEGEPLEELQPTRRMAVQGKLVEGEPTEELQPTRRMAVRGKLLEGDETEPEQGTLRRVALGRPVEGEQTFVKSEHDAMQPFGETEALPLEPVQRGVPAEYSPLTPAMPATSAHMSYTEWSDARVDGATVPEGFRLESLTTFDDGSVRVDANQYDAVTPLDTASVTKPDGTTVDVPHGSRLFLVKDNLTVDATAEDYQPFVMSYAADGTPTPLYTG